MPVNNIQPRTSASTGPRLIWGWEPGSPDRQPTHELRAGTFALRGTLWSTTDTKTTRPDGGNRLYTNHFDPKTTVCEGTLTLKLETPSGTAPRAIINGDTIELSRRGPDKFVGEVKSGNTRIEVEIDDCPPGSRLRYTKTVKTETVTREELDFRNSYTGRKWYDYAFVRRETIQQTRFEAGVGFERGNTAHRDPAGNIVYHRGRFARPAILNSVPQ